MVMFCYFRKFSSSLFPIRLDYVRTGTLFRNTEEEGKGMLKKRLKEWEKIYDDKRLLTIWSK